MAQLPANRNDVKVITPDLRTTSGSSVALPGAAAEPPLTRKDRI